MKICILINTKNISPQFGERFPIWIFAQSSNHECHHQIGINYNTIHWKVMANWSLLYNSIFYPAKFGLCKIMFFFVKYRSICFYYSFHYYYIEALNNKQFQLFFEDIPMEAMEIDPLLISSVPGSTGSKYQKLEWLWDITFSFPNCISSLTRRSVRKQLYV